jgi:hypothetical protein
VISVLSSSPSGHGSDQPPGLVIGVRQETDERRPPSSGRTGGVPPEATTSCRVRPDRGTTARRRRERYRVPSVVRSPSPDRRPSHRRIRPRCCPVRRHGISQARWGVTSPHPDRVLCLVGRLVGAPLRCPVLQRAGSPRASGRPRRFPVDVKEFEPEVLDSPQQAVQGRLVGSGAAQHRRIAHHADLRVVEDAPHPGTRDTADGDHVGAIGHVSRDCHSCREPPEGVSCLHPFRVCRPVAAQGRDDPGPELGQDAGWDFRPWHLRARCDGFVMMVRRSCLRPYCK